MCLRTICNSGCRCSLLLTKFGIGQGLELHRKSCSQWQLGQVGHNNQVLEKDPETLIELPNICNSRHVFVLQVTLVLADPLQFNPPNCGGGNVHVLVFVLYPPSQVTEQVDTVHAVH